MYDGMIAGGGWPGKDQGKGLGCWPAVIYFLVLVVLKRHRCIKHHYV